VTGLIALHPQTCPGRSDDLRWVTASQVTPFVGPVAAAPAPLAVLLDDGTLARVDLEPTAVLTRLAPGRTWGAEGPRVRTAVHAALADPAGWFPAGPATAADPADGEVRRAADDEALAVDDEALAVDDEALATATRRLLDGPTGDLVRSHGGMIELVDVRDGVVRVRMHGACNGCPAAGMTMRVRLEAQLRRDFPALREVVADGRVSSRWAALRTAMLPP
jgi:Fe-S cluster biogenesis protein NfuA